MSFSFRWKLILWYGRLLSPLLCLTLMIPLAYGLYNYHNDAVHMSIYFVNWIALLILLCLFILGLFKLIMPESCRAQTQLRWLHEPALVQHGLTMSPTFQAERKRASLTKLRPSYSCYWSYFALSGVSLLDLTVQDRWTSKGLHNLVTCYYHIIDCIWENFESRINSWEPSKGKHSSWTLHYYHSNYSLLH